MRIFFLGSVAIDRKQREIYKEIIKILEGQGHVVCSKHSLLTAKNIESMSKQSNVYRAKTLLKDMLVSDCVVFEGTVSTTGGGYYLCSALQHSVPVLYLTQEDYKGLYLASSNRLLKIKQYSINNMEEIKKIAEEFIKFCEKKKLNNRFNLMISDTMDDFLTQVSNDYGTSKADFIRDLIYEKMEVKGKGKSEKIK